MANINQSNKDNLFKAFGSFIEAFRAYVVLTLIKEAGDKWPAWYVEALHPTQRDAWNLGLKNGTQPENLIDYQNIKSFALKYRDLIKNDKLFTTFFSPQNAKFRCIQSFLKVSFV